MMMIRMMMTIMSLKMMFGETKTVVAMVRTTMTMAIVMAIATVMGI